MSMMKTHRIILSRHTMPMLTPILPIPMPMPMMMPMSTPMPLPLPFTATATATANAYESPPVGLSPEYIEYGAWRRSSS